MLHCLILSAALTSAVPAIATLSTGAEPPAIVANTPDKRVVNVLRNWLRDYLKGNIPLGNTYKNIASKSLAKKGGLIGKDMFQRNNNVLREGQFCYREEFEVLMEEAGKVNSLDCAEILLQYCAVGLDDVYEYTTGMIPFVVRDMSEKALQKINDTAAVQWMEAVAKGEAAPKGVHKRLLPAIRTAAVRALGRLNARDYGGLLRSSLASPILALRLEAADSLATTNDAKNLAPLVDALEAEKTDAGKRRLHHAVAMLISGCRHNVDKEVKERAGKHLLADLGKPSDWHYQMQLAELVRFYNMPEAVPALIALLERFTTAPEDITSGQLAGVLRHETHQELTKMTAAFYPMDDIAGWKGFWEREKDGFKIAVLNMTPELLEKKWREEEAKRNGGVAEATAEERPRSVGMNEHDFFGIPVRGSHVVFLVDSGYDMREQMPITERAFADRWEKEATRIEVMKIEVARALSGLAPATLFNVISYNTDVKAAFKEMSEASPRNITTGEKFAKKQAPFQNYNLAEGLDQTLGIEAILNGKPGQVVDEVFIVCNSVPQYGPMTNPNDLIALIPRIREDSKVRINTVFVGTVNDPDDQQKTGATIMEQFSKITGGKFVRP